MSRSDKLPSSSFNSLQVGSKREVLHHLFCKSSVSIPYRQDQNKTLRELLELYREQFQFLIGRIKTISGILFPSLLCYMFQFLIGRIKTQLLYIFRISRKHVSIPYRQDQNFPALKCFIYAALFQFLIGRIKTSFVIDLAFEDTGVSIPYRQDQNFYISDRTLLMTLCFNSLQVGSKLRTGSAVEPVKKVVSIPYRQDQNCAPQDIPDATEYVSIPYRQDQNKHG